MNDNKPKLALNKRTIARLNNLEMIHVRGGDGDETGISRNACGDEDEIDADSKRSILIAVANAILSKIIKCCDA